jgi:hypothetical protein
LIWAFKKNGLKFAFAAPVNEDEEETNRPAQVKGIRGFLACMTPVVVVVITMVFNLNALAVFIIGIVWAILMTVKGKWNTYMNTIVQSCYEGFKEGAPTAGLMFGIGMLLNAVAAPTTQEIIRPFMVAITPTSPVGLIVFTCILVPLSLYRGPFNVMGLGAGLAASMIAVGTIPIAALAAVFYASSRWPAQSCPTATQVVWAANFVGQDPVASTNHVQLPNWIFTAITVVILTLMYF